MIKVKVTNRDIKLANKRALKGKSHCYNCPIALALKRTQKKRVKVDGADDIYIGDKYYATDIKEVRLVDKFIEAFDNREKVKPISFTIYH